MIAPLAILDGLFTSFLIIATFTLIWKNNPFYIFAQSFMLSGRVAVSALASIVLLYGFIQSIATGMWWRIFPMILGLMFFTNLTKFKWVSRYPQIVVTGIGLGILFGLTIRAQIVNQILLTAQSFAPAATRDLVSATIVLIGVIASISYFIYAFTPKGRTRRLAALPKLGLLFIALTLGNAWAGQTISYLDATIGIVRVIIDFLRSLF